MTTLVRGSLITTPQERAQAEQVARSLDADSNERSLTLSDGSVVPAELLDLIRVVTHAVATGGSITIGSMPDVLTTTVAADLLGISRPTLMKLVSQGVIPARRVGSHTRLKSKDVLEFRRNRKEQQRSALRELRELEDELELD
ncbi:MAG: helix-turn-helix domain-containing protein [Nakamurella sp.]